MTHRTNHREDSPCTLAGHRPGDDPECPRCRHIRALAARAARRKDLYTGETPTTATSKVHGHRRTSVRWSAEERDAMARLVGTSRPVPGGRGSWPRACRRTADALNARFHGGEAVRSPLAVECAFEGWLRRRWWRGARRT